MIDVLMSASKNNVLGRLGENEHRRMLFDISEYQGMYPDATYALLNLAPGTSEAYPVANTTVVDNQLAWVVTSADLRTDGHGKCELVVYQGTVIAKSVFYQTQVLPALDGAGDVPEPWDDWQTVFVGLKADAEAAAEAAEDASQAIQDMRVEGETLPPGSDVTVTKTVSPITGTVTLEFGIPQGENGDDGFSPDVDVTDITGGHRVEITDKDGKHTFDVMDGEEGRPGLSPTATVTQTATGATITVTDAQGTTTAEIENGPKGDPGNDGVSPTVTVTTITGGHRVTITDADGTRAFDVMDGTDGEDGRGIASATLNADYTLTLTYTDGTSYTTPSLRGMPGADGYSPVASVSKSGKVATISITDKQGTTTATVSDGEDGDPGVSPTITVTDITGGHRVTITDATGQHSFDVMDGTGSVQDVQVNGESVVTDGVANVPLASNSTFGVIKVGSNNSTGLTFDSSGYLKIYYADSATCKAGSNYYRPIVPAAQHTSAFYGLAKAAGDTTQSASSNAVGTYTENAKSKISQMLGGSVTVTGTTPTITALPGICYVCGECATLDITLPASGIVDVVFESGATATVLTITPPSGQTVKWANEFDPASLDADTTYEINIADGLGVAASWT